MAPGAGAGVFMIDFFGSDVFFDFCMSASDVVPFVAAGAGAATSKGFFAGSLLLLDTKSKASKLTNLA